MKKYFLINNTLGLSTSLREARFRYQRLLYSLAFIAIFSVSAQGQSLTLSQSVSDPTPETDEVFEYIISVSCNSTTANCNNTVVSGFLPEEVDFTNFSDPLPAGVASATYDIATRYYEVTFNDGPGNSLAQGSTIQFSLQVIFPGATVETSVASNTVNATSTNATNASATASATVDVNNWVIPSANFPADKGGDSEQLPGGQQYWQVRIGNISFQTIDNYIVTDQIPALTTLTQIRTPEIPYINHPARLFYERSDNLGVWNLWENFNLNSRVVRYVTGLGLPPGVEVTQVQVDFGTMSPSALYNTQRYNDGFDTGLILYATVDTGLADGVTYQNCANYSGTIGGIAETDIACLTTTINSGIAVNEVNGDTEFFDMTESSISVANIGDTVKVGWNYYSEPEMTNDILGGVMSLVLPPGMTYVPGTFAENWACTAFDGEVTVIELDIAIDGRQIVRFVHDASLGNEFNIESSNFWDGCGFFIDVVIGNSVIEGDNTSEYYYNATGSTHDNCGTTDVDNILNGYAPDYCVDNATVLVVRAPGSAGVRAEKEVIGTLDSSYSQFPSTGTTVPGGLSNYRITLTNPNATPIDNIEIIDILPYINDVTILDETISRFSDWTPNLAAPITAPAGVTVFYSTVANPCRDELAGANPTPFPTGCTAPSWSAVAPPDITDVTALKFDLFGITLNQNDDITLEFEMRAPVNAPTGGEVSWNSFAYIAENATTNNPLLPTEAIKVGIETIPGTVPIGGDFVWDDLNGNGLQDSGEPGIDGVRIALIEDTNSDGNLDGGDVEYTWTISANGGQYIFSDFPNGNYFIQFSNFPSGYVETHQDIGSNEALDSDGATTDLIVFGPTTDRNDIDFGLYNGVLPPIWSCTTGLLTNSEFESNFTDWADFGNTSITNDAYVNTNAMLINGGQGGRGQSISVTPGQTYTMSFYAKNTGPESANGGFNVKDVNNNTIYSIARGVYENVYEYHSITMTVPENGDRIEVFGWKNAGAGAAYFDAFCLELVNDICGSPGEQNTDADAICNRYDIDDDNDGIRDVDESMCNGNWQELVQWTHNTPGNTGDPEILYPAGIASAGLEGYGSGITATLTTTYVLMDGVDQTDLSSAILDGDYLEYSISTQGSIPAIYLHQFRMTKHGLVSLGEEGNYGYDFSIIVSDNGFATSSVISDIFTVDPNVDPDFVTLFQEADDNYYYLRPSATYTFRIYFYNKTTSALVRALYDDFTIEAEVCEQVWDTDGDGYANSQDLDSDNDGLTDLSESGHAEADSNNDGIIDGANISSGLNGLFDNLESTADMGDIVYSISDSELTGDGIYDPYELDSDGDGCFDAEEEAISDPDNDGLVGIGAPTPLTNGLVSGHTYSAPPNNFWQDPMVGPCLSEICNDGIDNDGDGNPDYLDSDCDCPDVYPNPIDFDFSNMSVLTGTGLNLGDQILYSNVGTISGQSVDIVATVDDFSNLMVLEEHGNPGAGDNGMVELPSMNIAIGTEYYADIQYELFESGTSTPISGSFEIEIADIDSISTARVEIIGASQNELDYYFLNNPTNIVVESSNNTLTGTGTQNQSASDPEGTIKFSFINRNVFTLRYGMRQHLSTSTGRAAFIIDGNSFDNLGECFTGEICNDGIDNDGDGIIDCAVVSGNVFEDINYGGGDGRNYNLSNVSAQGSGWNAGDIGVNNAIVELYNDVGDFISDTTTNTAGDYAFELGVGDFSIRVVNHSVSSNRISNGTGQTIIPVQTFRHTGVAAVSNEIGGANSSLIDATANTSYANLSALTTASTIAQSVTSITMDSMDLTGVDFGFNFDVIVNTNDSGQGSIEQFILNSNELSNVNLDQEDNPTGGVNFVKDPRWETSIFMIPGAGVHTIAYSNQIEPITDSKTHLSGYTQDGSAQGSNSARTITIELDGLTSSDDGVGIRADSVHVSGLAIRAFTNNIDATTVPVEGLFVWGNYLGLEADGLTTDPANTGYGLYFRNVDNSFIGANGDNINDANEGNVVADSYDGLFIRDSESINIAGNIVGMDKTGNVNLGSQFNGVYLLNTDGCIVGFDDGAINSNISDFRNYLSGGGNDGIRISSSDNNTIAGNYIGTNIGATAPITNSNYGIQLQGTSSDNIIGTNANGDDDILERNIISGNGSGLRFLGGGSGDNNVIAGNWFGTDITGLNSLPNGHGISMNDNYTNTVIGTNGDNVNDNIEGNVISGNNNDGIRMSGISGMIVAGNKIGVGADGTTSLGNGQRGILIATTAFNNVIGYRSTMLNTDELIIGNVIKNNSDSGVGVSGSGTQNRISRNQLENNGGLGIDLGYDGVTSNDNGDGDSGANDLYNFPVITSTLLLNDDLTITGFAPAGSEIEFFIADAGPNPNPLPVAYTSSFGEGREYLFTVVEGSAQDNNASIGAYTNDGTGIIFTRAQNQFTFTVDVTGMGLTEGVFISATATNSNGSTSEFSNITKVLLNCGTAILNPHVRSYRSR